MRARALDVKTNVARDAAATERADVASPQRADETGRLLAGRFGDGGHGEREQSRSFHVRH
jgi:hypothetical protein